MTNDPHMDQDRPVASRILAVKICCFGDIIFFTPLLRALRNAYPESRIDILADPHVYDLCKRIPFIDGVVRFEHAVGGSLSQRIRSTFGLIRRLRREAYDMAVIGHRDWKVGAIIRAAGIGFRIGFEGVFSLTHSITFDEASHEVDRYLALGKVIGIDSPDPRAEIRPLDSDKESARRQFEVLGIPHDVPLVGILAGGGTNPGTYMPIKRWPVTSFASLIDIIHSKTPATVVLCGGDDDITCSEQVHSLCREKGRIVNVAGRTSLTEFMGLCSFMELFIGGDSGPIHMASAIGTATVQIFGPTDPRLVAPRADNARYIWDHIDCSPCYTPASVMDPANFRKGEFICRTGTHECMKELAVGTVAEAVLDLLEQHKDGSVLA